MTLWVNTAEGGTNTTDVTNANSGGSSGNAITSVTLNSGTVKFSSTQAQKGSLSYQITKSSTNSCFMVWDSALSTQFAFRGYVYYDALPSAGTGLFAFRSDTGGSARCGVSVSNTGVVSILDASETIVGSTATGVMIADDWLRVEALVDITDGDMSVRVYDGDSTTVRTNGSLDVTGQSLGASGSGWVRMGYTSSGTTAAAPLYLDDLALDDAATAFIGPSTAPSGFDGSFIRIANGNPARVRVPAGAAASVRLANGNRL